MRRALTALFRSMLRLFFRRIEVAGLENIPQDEPVVFAANHPNGLVDPLFILCFAPRRVSFLAKAPLFRYPLIGYFVRVFDSIPVYRKQDVAPPPAPSSVLGPRSSGRSPSTEDRGPEDRGPKDRGPVSVDRGRLQNDAMFARAREILRGGGSIAIFPEGTTHSDPHLRELKTGAARITLGAELPSISIVPVGIYYTAKQTFRSEALVWFGAPLRVTDATETVPELTSKIETQLASVTLQADSRAALELITRAERIFSAGESQALSTELEIRRRFVDGYHYLREHDPARLERLASLIRQFESELGGARLDPEDLTPRVDFRDLLRIIVFAPFAIVGTIVHFVPYMVVDALSKRLSRDEDEMIATIKFVAALLLYPLMWVGAALLAWKWAGRAAGAVTLLSLPPIGYVTLWVIEQLDEFTGNVRALMYRTRSRAAHARLIADRQLIRDQILSVAEVVNRS